MYKYSLQSVSKKTHCPKCGKKRFVPYINNETNEILHHTVGRCDREVNCGYHLTPGQYFNESKTLVDLSKIAYPKRGQSNCPPNRSQGTCPGRSRENCHPERSRGIHPNHYIKKSLKQTDNFTAYLHTIFTPHEVKQVIEMYKIGTSTHWNNATIFWQIDIENKVRAGKVILYNNIGHRSKYATWIHSILLKKKIITTYNLNQCLFGLHLINTNTKPIAIVESEKTACIMSNKFPKYCWLATGGSNNIADKYFLPLKSKKIILFPDLSINNSIFEKWNHKALELQKFGFDISTSTLLENIATEFEKQKGLDIADYFSSPPLGGFRGLSSHKTCDQLDWSMGKLEISNSYSQTKLNNEILPFGSLSAGETEMSRGQMGQVLSISQQALLKLTYKNPQLKKLINTFDLVII